MDKLKAIGVALLFLVTGGALLYWGGEHAFNSYLLYDRGVEAVGEVVSSKYVEKRHGTRKRRRIVRGYETIVREEIVGGFDYTSYAKELRREKQVSECIANPSYNDDEFYRFFNDGPFKCVGVQGEARIACCKVNTLQVSDTAPKERTFFVANTFEPGSKVKYWVVPRYGLADVEKSFEFDELWPPLLGLGLILLGLISSGFSLPKNSFKLAASDPRQRWRIGMLTPAQWIGFIGHIIILLALTGTVAWNIEDVLENLFHDLPGFLPGFFVALAILGYLVASIFGIWQARDGEMLRLSRDVKRAKLQKELSDLNSST